MKFRALDVEASHSKEELDMRFLAAISLLAAGLAFAGDASDQNKFQGAWQRVSIIDDGKMVEGAEKGSVVFSGSEYTLKEGDTVKSKGAYKLDESKSPKEFDVMPVPAPTRARR